MKFCGPFEVELRVLMVNDEGTTQAWATIPAGWGSLPGEKRLASILKRAESMACQQMPGFRLAGRSEFVNAMLEDVCGTSKVTVAGVFRDGDWDSYQESVNDDEVSESDDSDSDDNADDAD